MREVRPEVGQAVRWRRGLIGRTGRERVPGVDARPHVRGRSLSGIFLATVSGFSLRTPPRTPLRSRPRQPTHLGLKRAYQPPVDDHPRNGQPLDPVRVGDARVFGRFLNAVMASHLRVTSARLGSPAGNGRRSRGSPTAGLTAAGPAGVAGPAGAIPTGFMCAASTPGTTSRIARRADRSLGRKHLRSLRSLNREPGGKAESTCRSPLSHSSTSLTLASPERVVRRTPAESSQIVSTETMATTPRGGRSRPAGESAPRPGLCRRPPCRGPCSSRSGRRTRPTPPG